MIYAKSKADILVVSLTADQHIMKGNVRPYVPEELRAVNLAAFEMVDYVVIDQNAKPIVNLQIIQPAYFAKGYEYVKQDLNPRTQEEQDVIESLAGAIFFKPANIPFPSL